MWPGDVIIACWLAFLAYWYFSAGRVKATQERQSVLAQAAWRIPLALAAILLVGEPWPAPDRMLLVAHLHAGGVIGALLTLLGLCLAIWARRTLGGNWSSAVTLKHGHELIRSGPYGWVRNPIYTGLLAMFLGTALAFGRLSALAAVVLAAISFWIKLKQEETVMRRQFPDAFAAYRRQTKALIPFVL